MKKIFFILKFGGAIRLNTENERINLCEITYWFLIILTVISVSVGISPIMQTDIRIDSGVFQYIGWRMSEGETPYRDVWDHKPPVIYLINNIGSEIANFFSIDIRWGVWVLELLFLVLSCVVLWVFLHRYFSSGVAFVTILVFLLSWSVVIIGGNLTTEYTILFQLLILLCTVMWIDDRRPAYFFAIGCLTMVSFMTKQTAIGVGVASFIIMVGFLVKEWEDKALRKKNLTTLWLFAGGNGLVLVIFVIFFWTNQSLSDFIDQAFLFNFVYIDTVLSDKLVSLVTGFYVLQKNFLSLFTILGLVTVVLKWKKQNKALVLLLLLDFVLELFFVTTSGRSFAHYYLALLPVFTILSAFFFAEIAKLIPKMGYHFRLFAGVVIWLLLFANAYFLNDYPKLKDEIPLALFPFSDAYQWFPYQNGIVEYLVGETAPNDTVLIIGAETNVLSRAMRKSPTRYVYQNALTIDGYVTEEKLDEFTTAVKENQPAAILIPPTFRMFGELVIFRDDFLVEMGGWQACVLSEEIQDWKIYRCNWDS